METMSAEKPILYSCWGSSCSWRVRIALYLKGIDFEVKPISLDKEENFSDEFKHLNPAQQVPAFVVGKTALYESIAIINYLEHAFPEVPILPKDLIKRAQVRAFVDIIASGIQPLQNDRVELYLVSLGTDDKQWGKHWIASGFKIIENILSSTSGKYCFGDEITMADCTLVPQTLNAKKYDVDLTPYPNIQRVYSNLKDLDAFKKSNPINQPDFPQDLPESFKALYL